MAQPSNNNDPSNSSNASTPTTASNPMPSRPDPPTRLPSMKDLLSDVHPSHPASTSKNFSSSYSYSSRPRPNSTSTSHFQERWSSSERSTLDQRPASDDSSRMALDDYPERGDKGEETIRRVPSGVGPEVVETWTRTQRLIGHEFDDVASPYATSQEVSPRLSHHGLDLPPGETSRDPGEQGEAHEWTSVAPPRRRDSHEEKAQQQQQIPIHHDHHHPARSSHVESSVHSPPYRHSLQLATFGNPLSYQQQSQYLPQHQHPYQPQAQSGMLPPFPPGFSKSRGRASTLNLPRAEAPREYVAPRFSPTYPPGHPLSQAHLAAHLRQAPGSQESVGSASTGRSSLLNSSHGYGRVWEESRGRSDSLASATTRSSISAMSPSIRKTPLHGNDLGPKEARGGQLPNPAQSSQSVNSPPLLFAPLSPHDSHPPHASQTGGGRIYPTVLASGHAPRSNNGQRFSSGSYPPSPVSPMFADGTPNHRQMPVTVPLGRQNGTRRSWDADSLRALVSPSGPHPQLPSVTPSSSLGWSSQSPTSQTPGLPGLPAHQADSAPRSAHSTPPVPVLSLPAATDRLAHSKRRKRPPVSYASLITQAIASSPNQTMSLKDIYSWISAAHPNHYTLDGPDAQSWSNTVRHNLSLNKAFVKVPKSADDCTVKGGKGGLWTLDRNVIQQRAATGQGPDLTAALAAGDAMRSQGKGSTTVSGGSSSESEDRMGVGEASGTPSPRFFPHALPFPGPDSPKTLNERSSTATLKVSDQQHPAMRRRSKSHFQVDHRPPQFPDHATAQVNVDTPSVLKTSTPSFSSTDAPASQKSPSNGLAASSERPLAGRRPRGHTISNGEIAKLPRSPPPSSIPISSTTLQSPSKRKFSRDSMDLDEEIDHECRARSRLRNQNLRSQPDSNSSPLSSNSLLPESGKSKESFSSNHNNRNLKIKVDGATHPREEDLVGDESEFKRPSKSPKLTADLQLLAVNDKNEDETSRESSTPTQRRNDESQDQPMKISGLLC